MILYQREDGAPALEVLFDAETVWLSQQQIAELFQTSRTNIVEHIQHVYDEGSSTGRQPVGISDRFARRARARSRVRSPSIASTSSSLSATG